jgi:hypothetical protein
VLAPRTSAKGVTANFSVDFSLEDAARRCAVSVFWAPEVTPRELNVTVSITWDGTYTCINNAAGQRMHQHVFDKVESVTRSLVTIPVSEECCIACVCHDVCTKMRCNKLHGFEY